LHHCAIYDTLLHPQPGLRLSGSLKIYAVFQLVPHTRNVAVLKAKGLADFLWFLKILRYKTVFRL